MFLVLFLLSSYICIIINCCCLIVSPILAVIMIQIQGYYLFNTTHDTMLRMVWEDR